MSLSTKRSFIIAFLLIFSVCQPQDRIIDSLKTVLKNEKLHDTTKLSAIGNVMDSNYNENDPKFYYLNDLIGRLAQKNLKKQNNKKLHETYTTWLATYYNVRAIDYGHKKDAIKGLAAINKSISLYNSIKAYDDANYEVIIRASFYFHINENEKAISNIFSALKYFEKNKKENSGEIAYALSVLGNIYSAMGNHEKSIESNKKVIEYLSLTRTYIDHQNDYLKSVAYANIASSYFVLQKFQQTIEYGQKALELSQKTGDAANTSIILSQIGAAKMGLKKYSEAEALFKQALSYSTDERAMAQVYMRLGDLYFTKKELAEAQIYCDKALTLSKKIKDIKIQEQLHWLLYKIHTEGKDYKKALTEYQVYFKLQDSIKTAASKNTLEQQQLKYDFEKKELNLKLINQEDAAFKNIWLIALSGILLLVLSGGFFYYRNNRQKQAITVLEKDQIKQKLLVTQMNPHFIFNSIENIQGLIYDKKDSEAINYLNKFSVLTRQILENSNENYISLTEEVQMIENYLAIQQLLYNNKFDYSISVEDTIETDTIYLPPMLTQPFIENSIKHGLSNTSKNGRVDIHFTLKDSKLFFVVTDNGKGFETEPKITNRKSLAMTITRERLIGYTKNDDFVVQTDNIKDGNENIVGAKVSFEIPYIYEN